MSRSELIDDPSELHLIEKYREMLGKRPRVGDRISRSFRVDGFEGDEPYLVSVELLLQPMEGLVKPSEAQMRVDRAAVDRVVETMRNSSQ